MKELRHSKGSGARGGCRQGLAGLLCLLGVLFGVCETCRGYIMPAEQIIQFMAANFSKFETLIMDQDVTEEEPERTARQRMWLKSPDNCRAEIEGERVSREEDQTYWQLLVSNHESRLRQLLSGLEVNLEAVGFTRLDGVVAYRIGNKGPDIPKLLVEKERFLPLALFYRAPGGTTDALIRVRFRDYRKLEQGWYPFEVTLSSAGETLRKYTLRDIRINAPIDPSLFYPPPERAYSDREPATIERPAEEERLKKIIEAFEKKYQ